MYNNNICAEIELLIDDYLDGMLSAQDRIEDKSRMDRHIAECHNCTKYLEETVQLLERINTIPKEIDYVSPEKKNEIWNKIETRIGSGINSTGAQNGNIYNLKKNANEYSTSDAKQTTKQAAKKGSYFKSFRYIISAAAAVMVLGFIIYAVNQFTKNKELIGSKVTGDVHLAAYWKVANIKGSPVIDDVVMKSLDSVKMGQWITTDDSSKAELTVAGIGMVIIEPKTKIKLVKSDENNHRIALEYGTIAAEMNSTPRTFFVDAKSVTAVDLGCAYTFSIDSTGDGILYVKSGKVSLESPNRETVVPAGKVCLTRKDIGPGTPFRQDSSPELKKALMDFDFGKCGGSCVNVILKNAKKTDAVTLLNILPRVDNDYKEMVYSKVANFVPPPRRTPTDSIPFINMEHLDEWIEKVQDQVQNKIEESMSKLEESMEKMNDIQLQFDQEKWSKDWEKNWEKNWDKNWDKNWKFEWKKHKGDSGNNNDSIMIMKPDKEELKNTMEQVKEELQKAKEEMMLDNEQFKREMLQAQEEIERASEEMRRSQNEMEKSKEEKEKGKDEMKKHKEEMKKHKEELKEHEKEMKEHNEEMKEQEKNNDEDVD